MHISQPFFLWALFELTPHHRWFRLTAGALRMRTLSSESKAHCRLQNCPYAPKPHSDSSDSFLKSGHTGAHQTMLCEHFPEGPSTGR